MTARTSVIALALIAALGAGVSMPGAADGPRPEPAVVDSVESVGPAAGTAAWVASPLAPDSALDELLAGRFWHAARLLREAGTADGSAADVLLLARAEAGWRNWPAVAELLEDRPWLAERDSGIGLYLLGRAMEVSERWDEAAALYGQYASVVGEASRAGVAALARGARSEWHAGRSSDALRTLERLRPSPVVRSWLAVQLALHSAERGDPDGVAALGGHAIEPRAAAALWRAQADAHLQAGDSTAAADAFEALLDETSSIRRAEAGVELGRLRLSAGDSSRAEALLLEAFEDARGSARTRAAQALIDIGGHGYARTLELARILDRAGDGARALRGYDAAVELASEQGIAFAERSRLERARLMATVRARQEEALAEFRAIREATEDERIGARNLEVWAQMRGRQGQRAQEATLRRWLLEEYPGSPEAAEVAWSRGSYAEAQGRLDEALGHYRFLAENAGSLARAGEARMRAGQIHLRRANPVSAAAVFEQYLEDFPDGRRWQEASYWAGRTRLELGDSVAARAHLGRVLQQPIEYYAVMAAELLGVPYSVDLPEGPAPVEPGWLTEGLSRLDVLTEAGLERGAENEIDRLRERASGERVVLLRLAETLIERGRSIEGINLGWSILADDQTWDRRLLRVTYPFPYEELVRREAAEWGIDVFLMAAMIRQESAFKADIVSRAGAIGLMQVMPPTGAQLARAHGPRGFTEESLTKPEVNLHLGAAFFVDMSARYDHDLPLVLSAYNAGPTRATRWRRYPEVSDPLRFTERIPILETRGYVKSVRRNLGLYRALYGQD